MYEEELLGLTEKHLQSLSAMNPTVLVHQKVHHDLLALITAAQHQGFTVNIASAFRHFERQRLIWNNKFQGKIPLLDANSQLLDIDSLTDKEKVFAILRWSALPGASRHHWGTDFDLYAKNHLPNDKKLLLEPWEYFTGHQHQFYCWLKENMRRFGFFFPYIQDLGGVGIEPWHISHIDMASHYFKRLNSDLILRALLQYPIEGFTIVQSNISTIFNQYIANITQP